MSENLVVGCIGSSNALVREYVHDFGLCAINMTSVEESLRDHLRLRAFSRAEWRQKDGTPGVKAKKIAKIDDTYAEMTLRGLVREYERQGGDPELIAALDKLTDARNTLFHNHLPITDFDVMRVTTARIQEVRVGLHALRGQAQRVYHSIQAEDLKVFTVVVERVKREGMPDAPTSERLEVMLEEFERMVRKDSIA